MTCSPPAERAWRPTSASYTISRMDAITFPPAPTNEPNLTYAPGSAEREALVTELAVQERKQQSFRAVIGGKQRNGGGAEIKVVQPHDHQHVLGTFKNSTTKDAEAAIKAAGAAALPWQRMPFDERCAVILKAADLLAELAEQAASTVEDDGVPRAQHRTEYSADLRYHGQGFEVPVAVDLDAFDGKGAGLDSLRAAFDTEHERLFSFLLDNEQELVTVRATVTGPRPDVTTPLLEEGGPDASAARTGTTPVWVDGGPVDADLYDRGRLLAGNVVTGPAIVTEMDSTTLVLPGHAATVHPSGCLLITPVEG